MKTTTYNIQFYIVKELKGDGKMRTQKKTNSKE
jgi:hypothetical protein